jgi:hypothetical protein
MVKHALIVLVGLTALVDARRPPDHDWDDGLPTVRPSAGNSADTSDDDSPAFNMFGFSFGIGMLPVDGSSMLATSLGVALEHPVFRRTRIAAEYDWLWLSSPDASRMPVGAAGHAEHHATGHRATLGLRRELKASGSSSIRLFLDGELGATVALAHHSMTGVELIPGAYVGVRAGADMYTSRDASASRTLETAVFMRALAVPGGIGFTVGFGMFWGN